MQVTTRSALSVPVLSSISPARMALGTAPNTKCTVTGFSPTLWPAKPFRISRFLVLRSRSGVGSVAGGVTPTALGSVTDTARASRPHLGQFVFGDRGFPGPARADHKDVGERRRGNRGTRLRHDVAFRHLVGA